MRQDNVFYENVNANTTINKSYWKRRTLTRTIKESLSWF